ncbi:MAG: DUF1800 domain-containing protein [Cypionkella sp.]
MEAPSLIEEIRFGYGPRAGNSLSPGGLEPERVLAQIGAPDPAGEAWSRPPLADRYALMDQFRAEKMAEKADATAGQKPAKGIDAKNAMKAAEMAAEADMSKGADAGADDSDGSDSAAPDTKNSATKNSAMMKNGTAPLTIGQKLRAMQFGDVQSYISRPAVTSVGFVERLVNFWSNRISISNASNNVGNYLQSFRDEAIRPNIAGRYADLLTATIWHPAMQVYLTQASSIGPQSKVGKAKDKGLNENLAREFLELHSMGHGYTQTDVTEFAKLLAGMNSDANGRHVNKQRAEPGKKLILGTSYGEGMAEINRLVEDVAHRQETADAVAFFIARHFIADVPPVDLVQALSKTYLANDTELVPVYRTLLQHPSAADATLAKVRAPHEYAVASLRLTGLDGQEKNMAGFNKQSMQVPQALARMGQPPYRALRPDGWPEVADGWMTPPMMAARVDWAIDIARATRGRDDPSALVNFALGDMATPLLQRAVAGAEQRWEGLAVLIASPEFSRR